MGQLLLIYLQLNVVGSAVRLSLPVCLVRNKIGGIRPVNTGVVV